MIVVGCKLIESGSSPAMTVEAAAYSSVHMPRHSAVASGMSRRGLRASSAPLAIMSKPTYLHGTTGRTLCSNVYMSVMWDAIMSKTT
jgi:hypothetical protein